MKYLFSLIVVLTTISMGLTQPCWQTTPDYDSCDISGQCEFIPPAPAIYVGDTTLLKIVLLNWAQGSRCYYLPHTIQGIQSFPAIGKEWDGIDNLPRAFEYVDIYSVTDQFGTPKSSSEYLFDYYFDYDNYVFVAENRDTIFDYEIPGANEVVIIRVRAVACQPGDPTCTYPKLWNTQYNTVAIGCWPADDPANNSNTSVMQILGLPLPIELKSFTAKGLDCKTSYIRWETASELNNEYMELQRSADGYNYTAVTKFSGNNVGNKQSRVYDYTDTDLRGGQAYYYRLKQVDYDGKVKVFDPTIVRTELCFGDIAMRINPNPGIDKVNVLMEGIDESKTSSLTIINGIGEIVRVIDLVPGTKEKDIDVSALTPGVYTFKWTDGEVSPMQQRFVKIR